MLPSSIDLRPTCPPVYDQGALGSCGPNAAVGALQFDQIKQKETPVMLSRLFVYFDTRKMEHTIDSDAGTGMRDVIKTLAKQGACAEDLWPYDIGQFTVQPPPNCYQEAVKHKALTYQRLLQSLAQMKACLIEGYPFLFGISVYESFESDAVALSGIVPMPAHNEILLGGHALLCIGFHDAEQMFIFRNSWGTEWNPSDKYPGYGYIPYAYLLNSSLAGDFWTIRTVQ
jgi:C1A family cysteine protease